MTDVLKSFVLVCIASLLFSCKPKQPATGAITGELQNASGIKVYFERITDQKDEMLDSAVADNNGKFSIPNRADKPDYYLLRTDARNVAFLVLNGGETIHITGDAKNLDLTYDVQGSEDTHTLLEMRHYDRHLSDSLNHIYTAFRDANPGSKDSVGQPLQMLYDSLMRSFALSFLQRHPESIVSMSASQYLDRQRDITAFQQLNDTLQRLYPDNLYVREFQKLMEDLHHLPVGSPAPDFKLKTPDGKEIALSSYRGKVTLIDFWASWCGPCRKENPHVLDTWRRFKDRGFDILGVSLDDNAASWRDAIQRDGLTWTQVSELKKWDAQVVQLYQVSEIPYSVLLDRQGKIIAKGMHGTELDVKIEEALAK